MIHSSRKWVTINFYGEEAEKTILTIEDLCGTPKGQLEGTEFLYALQEQTDKILDLVTNEVSYVYIDRNEAVNDQALIKRID